MKIVIVGTGYVGLVTGACFAETGNHVTCVDIDAAKVALLRAGTVPIYEPGLTEMVQRNLAADRLQFVCQVEEALAGADFVFLAVGTPQAEDGTADLSALWSAVHALAKAWPKTDGASQAKLGAPPHEPLVVIKSTVPVGTNAAVTERLRELCGPTVEVASNPEFLREGSAIDDFMRPDRVVVGVRRQQAAAALRDLYRPFQRTGNPFLAMSPESAEMTKYVANALLATKISFINEVANLCGRCGADINDVRQGIGHDQRIGFAFLFPGLGYGGSCFPKDVKALIATMEKHQVQPRMLKAVDATNQDQKTILLPEIQRELGDLRGKRLAVWGLSFKPRTDDIREAPAMALIAALLARGASIKVHDPAAMDNVRKHYNLPIEFALPPQSAYDALTGPQGEKADALVICTEWKEYQQPDLAEIRRRLKSPLIFDGRNIYEREQMRTAGFCYISIGRAPVRP